jgi:hypothetical protein
VDKKAGVKPKGDASNECVALVCIQRVAKSCVTTVRVLVVRPMRARVLAAWHRQPLQFADPCR